MSNIDSPTFWADIYPEGRHIFYEGDDPYSFIRRVKERFNFDPSEQTDLWGIIIDSDDSPPFVSYQFLCPPEHLDELYAWGECGS